MYELFYDLLYTFFDCMKIGICRMYKLQGVVAVRSVASLHLRDVIKWVKPVNYFILTLRQSELRFYLTKSSVYVLIDSSPGVYGEAQERKE